jgi:hypothetical protein
MGAWQLRNAIRRRIAIASFSRYEDWRPDAHARRGAVPSPAQANPEPAPFFETRGEGSGHIQFSELPMRFFEHVKAPREIPVNEAQDASIRRRPRAGHFLLRRLDQRSGWRSANSMAAAR